MKSNILIVLLALLLVGGAVYYFVLRTSEYSVTQPPLNTTPSADETPLPVEPGGGIGSTDVPTTTVEGVPPQEVIGRTDGGNEIVAYHFGKGDTELLFVGGTHAGYSANTVLVAYELMDYLAENPDFIPDSVMVTVIPVLNPDGLESVYKTTGRIASADLITDHSVTTKGRFNSNNVDINRNFDCQWKEESTWQNRTVSGGTEPFSEAESRAIRDYVETHDIAGAVVWYSAAGGVFASSCNNGVMDETKDLTNLFAEAAGYKAYEEFNFYEINGDMVNWFAKKGIPAISVLMSDHENPEWSKNLKGIDAMLTYFANQ